MLDGGSARGAGADDVDAARRQELAAHRRLIASALSAELGAGQSGAIERELGQIDAEMGAAYARGERPAMDGGLPAELGRRIGVGTDDVAEAFEAMAATPSSGAGASRAASDQAGRFGAWRSSATARAAQPSSSCGPQAVLIRIG